MGAIKINRFLVAPPSIFAIVGSAVLFAFPVVAGAATWSARVSNDPPGVSISGTARDGTSLLSGGCNVLLGTGFGATLYNYAGDALRRMDDQTEPVVFEISGGQSGTRSFGTRMHYFAPEKAWVITDQLPGEFYEVFAQGETLTIRNANLAAVVTFDLGGSAEAVRAVRSVCGP